MKLDKTWRNFIKEADDFDEEDKSILLEIFERGDQVISTFDRADKCQEMQEIIQGLHFNKMKHEIGYKLNSQHFPGSKL